MRIRLYRAVYHSTIIIFIIMPYIYVFGSSWILRNFGLHATDDVVPANNSGQEKRHPNPPFSSNHNRQNEWNKMDLVSWFLNRYRLDWNYNLTSSPWKLASGWMKPREIYPDDAPEMGAVLRYMSSSKIVKADFCPLGNHMKMDLTLSGGQKVMFKAKKYERDEVINGSGFDRHNGEIAAFTLDRILGFRRTPLAVGRILDLSKDVIPVATWKLLKTFYPKGTNVCFHQKVYSKHVCSQGDRLEGVLKLYLPPDWNLVTVHNEWSVKDIKRWSTDERHCEKVQQKLQYQKRNHLHDVIDASIFDYLLSNINRHHEYIIDSPDDSMLVMLDNGKSVGNPDKDETFVLAPLLQCCRLRRTTWERLQLLRNGVLGMVMGELLSQDPLAPVLAAGHFKAMDRRIDFIQKAIETCMQKFSPENVFAEA